MKRVMSLLLLVFVLLAIVTGAAQAQDTKGSIRGVTYQDVNADGVCVDTGEPVLADVPLILVADDGKTTVNLKSGEDGTYGLVAAGLGTWTVTADPPAPWVVTSENPRSAFIGSEQKVATGVDFCLADITVTPVEQAQGAAVVLPASGAPVAPMLFLAGVIGAGFVAIGAGLEIRRRRSG